MWERVALARIGEGLDRFGKAQPAKGQMLVVERHLGRAVKQGDKDRHHLDRIGARIEEGVDAAGGIERLDRDPGFFGDLAPDRLRRLFRLSRAGPSPGSTGRARCSCCAGAPGRAPPRRGPPGSRPRRRGCGLEFARTAISPGDPCTLLTAGLWRFDARQASGSAGFHLSTSPHHL